MNYSKLIEMAEKQGKDQEFIELLKNKPLYPISHTDHEVAEFGKKVEFIGDTNATGIKQKETGYILGIARHNEEAGRKTGWMEIAFSGHVYGLFFNDVNFHCV